MLKELTAMNEKNTWSLVDQKDDQKVLTNRWVFRKKDDTYKARLVVRGFEQESDLQEIYAPVARMSTIRSLLSLACKFKLRMHQVDVKNAFLNSDLLSEVLIEVPYGFRGRRKGM